MKILSKRLVKKFKSKPKSVTQDEQWPFRSGTYYTSPYPIMCDAPAFGGCHGGTVQDESCLVCPEYVKGSNPRVEAFRDEDKS